MTDIGAALGKIPSGIFILTVRSGTRSSGMLASWVMQASFEPPMLTVGVRKDRFVAEWLAGGANLAVNILSDDEKFMISHFGRGFKPDENAFAGMELLESEPEVPVLADALAYLVGSVEGTLATGDHVIFAVRVTSGRMLRDGVPMTHIRKDGMRY